ncbi:putative protein OS=Castellaniella defragrans (strain DSM / CCUG 39792 / 65Phen) OX=1437824 GN=BN940_17446 PE=4 SV=1 [Castellaniella denitrificans]|uniref:hypothetical protein n=1 Tax=Castellaniella sp. TaxID=1955812 RepID=UPI002AFEFA8C|nr:hypothetical protein [Castellaniella sp.]
MAEAQPTHGRGEALAVPHGHPGADARRAADPAGREAFRKAPAHWPLLAEMDRYLAWERRAPPTRDDGPDAAR